jgi:AcrR family transcriptional regulator
MRRAPNVDLGPVLQAIAVGPAGSDPVSERILDAAAAVLAAGGLRRCTVEEIAQAGRLGRTTVYRRFDGRDEIVQAVLGREVRRTLGVIAESVAGVGSVADKVVEGLLAGLDAFRRSPVLGLARTEPDLLALATSQAQPLVALATEVLVDLWRRETRRRPTAATRQVAEVLVRLGMSFALAPPVAFDLDDRPAARKALHALVDPLLEVRP